MADQHPRPNTTEYSSSQAPETQATAQTRGEQDYRAIPGGDPSRATAALGMESLDHEQNVSTDVGHASGANTREDTAPRSDGGQS